MEKEEQYSFNCGEYIDPSPQECVQYMVEQGIPREHIIGSKLEVLKLRRCIPEQTIGEMQDLLYDSCEDRFDEGEYLEKELSKVWKSLKDIEMFYPSGEYYTITEEDYEEEWLLGMPYVTKIGKL